MNISEEIKYNIFKISWVLLMLGTTCDFMLANSIKIVSFDINLTLSTVSVVQYILIFFIVFPLKEINRLIEDKYNKINILIISLMLILAYISSYFSLMQKFAIVTTISKFTLYFFAFIITLIYSKYFAQSGKFILKSFIFLNFFIILSSIADYFFYDFNRLLVGYFGHVETKHSMLRINGIPYLRPSGFVTDTNLTAFSIAFSSYLLLLNNKRFNKYFKYLFYMLAGYSFGMLASRSALLLILFLVILSFILKLIPKKHIIVFSLIFFIIQSLTPQTQARFFIFSKKPKKVEEIETGRPIIWKADMLAIRLKPLLGLGSGIFFKQSDIFISKVLNKIDDAAYYAELNNQMHEPEEGVNPHNIFLSMFIEYGIPGLLLFTFLIIYNFRYIFKKRNMNSLIVFIGILFISCVSNYAPYYKYFLLLCIVYYINAPNNLKMDYNENNHV